MKKPALKKQDKQSDTVYLTVLTPLEVQLLADGDEENLWARQSWQSENRRKAVMRAAMKARREMPALGTDELANMHDQKFAKLLSMWFNKLLENSNYSQEELKKRTVLEEATKQDLIGHFRAAMTSLNLAPKQAREFFDSVSAEVTDGHGDDVPSEEPIVDFEAPSVPPALYKDRADRKQKPDSFIRDTYPEWVARPMAFPRSVFADIDPPLYTAISRYGLSEGLDKKFPKTAGRNRQNPPESDAEILEQRRARDRDRASKKRAKQRAARNQNQPDV